MVVTMWHSVVLCCWVICGVHVSVVTTHDSTHVEKTHPSLLRAMKESSFLSNIGRGSYSRIDPGRFVSDSVEELMMEDTELYDEEEDTSEGVQLQSRAVRSPRRCFRHGESCLGHQLPCCDPCDTCYCRFFNAICYCRRIGQACAHGRH